ncbi:MAG: hypothetical protein HC822_10585 [Oscillochloris sp.]|nr:hypothetical protein [Oscillochloris sp.]
MTDHEPHNRAEFPAGGFNLGGAAADGFDSSLQHPAPPPPSLILPRGALLIFAKSGGVRFTSRHCIVYRNGRVERGSLAHMHRPTYLSAAEIRRLRRLVLRSRLALWAGYRAPAPRDGYSYELTARYGSNLRSATFADGAIPAIVAPLIRNLQLLLPERYNGEHHA